MESHKTNPESRVKSNGTGNVQERFFESKEIQLLQFSALALELIRQFPGFDPVARRRALKVILSGSGRLPSFILRMHRLHSP